MLKRHYNIIKMNKLTKIIFITFISLILLFFKIVSASEKIKIPMDARLESLNVSNASSVILFEVFRQREL